MPTVSIRSTPASWAVATSFASGWLAEVKVGVAVDQPSSSIFGNSWPIGWISASAPVPDPRLSAS